MVRSDGGLIHPRQSGPIRGLTRFLNAVGPTMDGVVPTPRGSSVWIRIPASGMLSYLRLAALAASETKGHDNPPFAVHRVERIGVLRPT